MYCHGVYVQRMRLQRSVFLVDLNVFDACKGRICAGNDMAKDGVLAVQVHMAVESDKELAAVGVWRVGVGHRHDAARGVAQRRADLVDERRVGTPDGRAPFAGSRGVARLDHKT